MAPMEVCLSEDRRTLVHPDLMIVQDSSKLTERGIQGAPDFVAEVVTAVSRRRDCFQKLVAYMEAGVKEYWIVDPKAERTVVYLLGTDSSFEIYTFSQPVPVGIYGGELTITVDELI